MINYVLSNGVIFIINLMLKFIENLLKDLIAKTFFEKTAKCMKDAIVYRERVKRALRENRCPL